MATKYPTELDSFSTSNANSTASENTHPELHNNANSAINAIETELGANPSGTQSTVAVRVQRVEETSVNLVAQGGVGDNSTDNAAALTAAEALLPEGGGRIYVPEGNFVLKTLGEITKPSVTLFGVGWDQSTVTNGSVIKAGVAMASLLKVPSTAPTFRMDGMSLSGGGNAESVLLLESLNCQIRDSQVRQPKTAGSCVNIAGESAWLTNLRINGANATESTGIIVNGTDATIAGCKPVNVRDGIQLKSSSSGAILTGNHITPGSTIGRCCIYAPEATNNITISSNRIDNHKLGAAIQLVFSANTLGWNITNNVFFQNVIENEVWAAIGLDVSAGNSYGITITGNTVRSAASHVYATFVAAVKLNGEASTNKERVKKMGSVIANNTSYSKAFYGSEIEPMVGGTNTWSEAGTTWEVK